MKIARKIFPLIASIVIAVSACTPYGHWGRYDYWSSHCPGFPSVEEVEQVLKDNKELLSRMLENNLMQMDAEVSLCPTVRSRSSTCYSGCDGAFITMYSTNKAGALKMMDEVNARAEGLTMFYGIPFRFIRI